MQQSSIRAANCPSRLPLMYSRIPSLKASTSERRDEVERNILAALERLLNQEPFTKISIEDLAGEAGIQRTAFYFYFANKQDVLARLVGQVADEIYEEAQGWLEEAEPNLQNLRAALDRVAQIFVAHRPPIRAAVEVSTYVEEMGNFWRALVNRFVDAAEQRIGADQKSGRVFADLDPRLTAEALVWMAERTCYEFLVIDQRDPDRLVDTLARIWANTLLPQSTDA